MGVQSERLYRTWYGMKKRCFNPKNDNFHRYGGRGITVCNEWLSYQAFKEWALSNGYADDLYIDRIDNDGNYCPENCRWVDLVTQSNNRSTNLKLTMNGRTQTLAEWSRETGIEHNVIRMRKKAGWSDEDALTKDVRHRKIYSLNGEVHSLVEWEKITGIPQGTIRKRCAGQGLSMEEAVQNQNFNYRYVSYDGKTQSVAEWAREYDINPNVLRLRLFRYGWDMHRALTTPVVNHRNPDGPLTLTYQGRTQTVLEWSKEVGIKSSTISRRKRLGWDDERALTTPVRGSKNQAETA